MSSEKKNSQGKTTELINLRFYENQKRQALTTTESVAQEGYDDLSFVTTTVNTTEVKGASACDTEELNPSPGGVGSSLLTHVQDDSKDIHTSETDQPVVVPLSSTAASLAISAPSDKSRKGSVDRKIWNLVNLINSKKDSFFTTSSCSGRIILYSWDRRDERADGSLEASASGLKKGCKWLLVSHDEITPEGLANAYMTASSETVADVFFKMEPCILHVQCRQLSNARKLIHIATESGFRNSGMVIGKENRITVAIRSAMGLEVPLPTPSHEKFKESECVSTSAIIQTEYLRYLADAANAKMRENWSRNEKLTELFSKTPWNT